MNDGGDQTARNWNRQADETLLIDLWRPFCQGTWSRRLHVEPREPESAADHEHEGNEPGQLSHIHPVLECCPVSPYIGEYRGGQSKRHYVGQRIQLDANFSRAPGHARNATVEHVTNKSPANRHRCMIQPVCCFLHLLRAADSQQAKRAHRRHQRVEPGKNVHRREERWRQMHPLLQALMTRRRRRRTEAHSWLESLHAQLLIFPMMFSPPRTCIPILTTISISGGISKSVRDPN